jgi:hypothetical protein
VRLWKITYLDDTLRILRAGKDGEMDKTSIFIAIRDEKNR